MKKRSDGRYQKKVSLGSKTVTIYGKTIKEVNEKYAELMHLKGRGVILTNEKLTVEQLCQEWLHNEKEGNIKPQSYYQLQRHLDKMCKYIGDIRVRDLTAYNIEAFRDQMREADTPCEFNFALSPLKSMLDFAIRRDIIVRNVASGIKRIKYEKAPKRALTPHELAAIRRADLNVWQRAWIDLLYYTGIRRGELLSLTVKDIDFKKKQISINKTLVNMTGEIQSHTKTNAGMRIVVMPDALIEPLRAWCDIVEHGLLFATAAGTPLRSKSFNLRWSEIAHAIFGEAVPADFTPHLFRHTYASNLYKAGVDIKTAQYLLGHNDIKTTMDIYTHFGSQDVDADRINAFFGSQKVVNAAEKPHKYA